jgi:glucose/arabinose dehydrogenase
VGPGWANPATGKWDDPRFTARDGRKFGPLPKSWAIYKGLYHHGDNIIISYAVGSSNVLEQLGMEKKGDQTVFTRTLDISSSSSRLKLKVAPKTNRVEITGSGAQLSEEDGFIMMTVLPSQQARVKLFIADSKVTDLEAIAKASAAPESLTKYTAGGPAHYPQELTSAIVSGKENGMFAVDQLTPPFENPWKARMKLSGIDFMKDGNTGAACTTDGDVFLINGLTNGGATLKWKRIAAGLFQPLGLKIVNDQIFVICRDQLVRLRDFNGDGETDFYENFNHDHQVTDHFHEFAMGLQTDSKGNFYYAKSGRHAREALIPQHGTLIKVSKDGSKSDIIASGFRAANGVCINPDGSFLVTDQQGYWNPMNRINWIDVSGKSKFYGNMWGYNPPPDTSDAAMEPPMIWVDMEFDRSPSELLWVNSEKWGPFNGGLLSFSYGYGKVQLVLHEEVNGQKQGAVVDIPGMKFYTGVMRGRFHPDDKHLYLCGMSAWSTSQNMRTGDLYRIRYTGKPVTVPVGLAAEADGIKLTFASSLNADQVTHADNYEVQTWDIIRSKKYGSERHETQTLKIDKVELSADGKTVKLFLPDIRPIDVMTIKYKVVDAAGNVFEGRVQNTIHNLRKPK